MCLLRNLKFLLTYTRSYDNLCVNVFLCTQFIELSVGHLFLQTETVDICDKILMGTKDERDSSCNCQLKDIIMSRSWDSGHVTILIGSVVSIFNRFHAYHAISSFHRSSQTMQCHIRIWNSNHVQVGFICIKLRHETCSFMIFY